MNREMKIGDHLTEDMFFRGMMVIVNDGKKDQKFIIEKVQPMRRFNESKTRLLPPYEHEIILKIQGNVWFSLGKFNESKSWVKKITVIEDREYFEAFFKKNCLSCAFCSYETGDVGDPEGYVCNKKDLYGKAEEVMLKKMERKSYRSRQKRCFKSKEVQHGTN